VREMEKEIVLFFRVTNWFSTVKNLEITIFNFPRKRYHFENTFLDHLSHCYKLDGPHRFCIYGGHRYMLFFGLELVKLQKIRLGIVKSKKLRSPQPRGLIPFEEDSVLKTILRSGSRSNIPVVVLKSTE
jgi:hypothetical protein